CPPRPEMLLDSIVKLHDKIQNMKLGANREAEIEELEQARLRRLPLVPGAGQTGIGEQGPHGAISAPTVPGRPAATPAELAPGHPPRAGRRVRPCPVPAPACVARTTASPGL